jgi:acetyl-CoA carboxylase biotin carboxyl carrier protein
LSEKKPEKIVKPKAAKAAKPTQPVNTENSGPMDLSLLERIVKLMEVNDLSAVELRDGEKRVFLQRGVPASAAPAPAAAPSAPAARPAAAEPTPAEIDTTKYLEIKSPMVGTFYTAPSPDAKPFVKVGSEVTEETDVCVIEAMKVFNNVKAECKGTIARIVVGNGEVVEFGQVLFLVKP